MTSKNDRRPVRMPGPVPIIKGYLAEALPPASRDPNTGAFQPGVAQLNVWGWKRDAANPGTVQWVNLEFAVSLRNTDETLTGEEDAYCEAEWFGDHWSPRRPACAASLVPADWRAANH